MKFHLPIFLATAAALTAGLRAEETAVDPAKPAYVLKIDYSADESLKPVAEKMQALFGEHFGAMVKMLAAEKQEVPAEITLVFDKNLKIPGQASGARLQFGVEWFRQHPGDVGVLIHELSHVVQAYPSPQPWWITEGLADYVRAKFAVDDPKVWSLPKLTRLNRYDEGYRVTAAFFIWVEEKFADRHVMRQLNLAMKEKAYTDKFWQGQTGKSVEDLWAQCIGEVEAADEEARKKSTGNKLP